MRISLSPNEKFYPEIFIAVYDVENDGN